MLVVVSWRGVELRSLDLRVQNMSLFLHPICSLRLFPPGVCAPRGVLVCFSCCPLVCNCPPRKLVYLQVPPHTPRLRVDLVDEKVALSDALDEAVDFMMPFVWERVAKCLPVFEFRGEAKILSLCAPCMHRRSGIPRAQTRYSACPGQRIHSRNGGAEERVYVRESGEALAQGEVGAEFGEDKVMDRHWNMYQWCAPVERAG